MRIASLVALLMAMLFLLGPAGTSSAAEPADPVTVVENFLLGRDKGRFLGRGGGHEYAGPRGPGVAGVMRLGWATVSLAVLTALAACAPAPDAPESVVKAFLDGALAYDEQAVRAVLAEDVVRRDPSGTETHGSVAVARLVTSRRVSSEVWNVRAAGDTVTFMSRVTLGPDRLPDAEMQAVVVGGRIQSLSPTRRPLPRRDELGGAAVQQQPTGPLVTLLGVGLAAFASAAVVLRRSWWPRREAQSRRAPGHLLTRLRPPPSPIAGPPAA